MKENETCLNTHMPIKLGHISNENDQQKYQVIETLLDIIAGHYHHIALVEFLEYTALQLNKLFFKKYSNKKEC